MKKILALMLVVVLIVALSASAVASPGTRVRVAHSEGGTVSVVVETQCGNIVNVTSGYTVSIPTGHHWITINAVAAPGYQLRDDAVFRIEFTDTSAASQRDVPIGERVQLRHPVVGNRLVTVMFEPDLGDSAFDSGSDGRVFYELPRHGFHEIGASCLANLRFLLRDEFNGMEPTNLMVREYNRNWRATGRHLTNANPRLLQMGYVQNATSGIWTVYDVRGDWCLNPGFNYSVEFYFGNESVFIWFVVS
ncbi:MAG: hypothetical protein FWB75_01705 [Oscillospiraceae bacterium]|nr:hypothetical protein [Oscillospiraceae bacterium]